MAILSPTSRARVRKFVTALRLIQLKPALPSYELLYAKGGIRPGDRESDKSSKLNDEPGASENSQPTVPVGEMCDSTRVVITGGLGYIGSHVAACLARTSFRDALRSGVVGGTEGHGGGAPSHRGLPHKYELFLLDIADPASAHARRLLRLLADVGNGIRVEVCTVDIRNAAALHAAFVRIRPDCVLHLAALKSVPESVREPRSYYRTNVGGTLNVLDAMVACGCYRIVYSSSASVYGSATPPYDEERTPAGGGIKNPYGRTKYAAELLVEDVVRSDHRWRALSLRYFNPLGAHPTGEIGEPPPREARDGGATGAAAATNIMSRLLQCSLHDRPFDINGMQHNTPDGSPVRDYVHVMDLAAGHLAAVRLVMGEVAVQGRQSWSSQDAGEGGAGGAGGAGAGASMMGGTDQVGGGAREGGRYEVVNLGTGHGYSVLELVRLMRATSGCALPTRVARARPGDPAMSVSTVMKARTLLGWAPEYTVEEMCATAWQFSKADTDRECPV